VELPQCYFQQDGARSDTWRESMVMISRFLEDCMISTAIMRLEPLISLCGATIRIMCSTTKHANWHIKENTANEIRQFVSKILRHTNDNMQCHIQMCVVHTAGHFLQKIWCHFAKVKQGMSYQYYHILFIHLWSIASYLDFFLNESPCTIEVIFRLQRFKLNQKHLYLQIPTCVNFTALILGS
jgi:hypothetical protein